MLTLTKDAATVLDQSRSQQGISGDATLRVASAPAENGETPGLTLGFVDAPLDGDRTGESHGMPVCVSPDVADALSGAQLDVQRDGPSARFVLVPPS